MIPVSEKSDERPLAGWIDFRPDAVRNRLSDVAIESRDHGEIRERGALHHDGIDRVQHQRRWYYAARLHVVEHPGRGDAALGGIEHKHTADIALAGELVLRPREYAAHAVEIVARGKSVLSDEREPGDLSAHPGFGEEDHV